MCICFQMYRPFLEACTRNRGAAKLAVFGNANWVEAEILDFFYSIISIYTSLKCLNLVNVLPIQKYILAQSAWLSS